MADIFISYTRDDAGKVGDLAAELEQLGFSVFWDTEVLPGQLWRDVIHDELVRSSCVIVAWSHGSTRSRWVVEEASEALEAGKLLPVLLDGSLPPFGFRGVEAANLSAWTPGVPNAEFENLISAVGRVVADAEPEGGEAAEVPPPRPYEDEAESESSAEVAPLIDAEADEPAEAMGAAAVTPQPEEMAPPRPQEEAVPISVEDQPVSPPPAEDASPPQEKAVSLPPAEDAVVASVSQEEAVSLPSAEDAVWTEPAEPAGPASPVPDPSPPAATTDPGPERDEAAESEGILARLGTAGRVGIGAVGLLVIVLGIVIASGGGGEDPPATTIASGTAPVGGVSTTTGATTTLDDVAVTNIVESDTVTVFRAGSVPVIDGDLGDWEGVPEAYRLRTEVYREDAVLDRLGEDSPGVVTGLYDDAALYLAVISDDDIYSQQNTGNQIYRGDALDINLTTASPEAVSARPDGDDFQLTMTPRAADGGPSIVWFTGNGNGFADNTTDLPVVLAGAIADDGSWQLEAAIPWSVFGLQGPPAADLTALVAVFDNDGEVVDGRPQQTLVLGHTEAEFQRPLTWGTLRLDR